MQRLSLIILNICPRNSVEAPGVLEAVVLDGVQGGVSHRHTSLGQPWEAVCAHGSSDGP